MQKTIIILFLLFWNLNLFAGAEFYEDPSNNRYQVVYFDFGSGGEWKRVFDEVDGQDYGQKYPGDTWILKGGQAYLWADNGTTISSVVLHYRVYKDGTSPGSFSSMNLTYSSTISSTETTYYYLTGSANILDHNVVNSAGTYYVEFYYSALTSDGPKYFYTSSVPAQASFSTNSALPVELTTFNATVEGNEVALNWATANEINNYGFYVERLKDELGQIKSDWVNIGFVKGHGNSNSPKVYSYNDNSVLAGSYKYRLRQVDIDGKYDYSPVVEIIISAPENFELGQNYPNPFNPKTSIEFSLGESADVTLLVYNTIGQKVAELVNQRMDAGVHKVDFNAENLNSGIYIYMLRTDKATFTKKMILMK